MWRSVYKILAVLVLAGAVHGQEVVTDTDKRYSVETPKGWTVEAKKDDIDLKSGQVTIHVYPASDKLTTLDAVADNIIQHYNKQGITTGPKQRLAFPGGEALWTEAPGTERPYLGAVSRGGKFFFVNAEDKAKNSSGVLEAFLAAVRSVRPASAAAQMTTDKSDDDSWVDALLDYLDCTSKDPEKRKKCKPAGQGGSIKSAPKSEKSPTVKSQTDSQVKAGSRNDYDALSAKAKALTAEAIPGLRKGAEGGDAESQLLLGWAYTLGKAVKKDQTQAFGWFKKSAEQRNGCAQAWLGSLYESGTGIAKDTSAALQWYRAGSARGCVRAEGRLGHLYFEGEGVAKDRDEGLRRMRRAAELGDSWSQAEMGYHAGEEPKDYAEAARWYRLAADEDEWAAYRVGYLYENGLGFAKNLPEALNWYRKAAAESYSEAQFKVGEMYARGEGAPRDRAEAMKWYRKAADNGHNLSKFIAATQYEPTGYETVTVGSGFQARGSGACKWYQVTPTVAEFETGLRWSDNSGDIEVGFSLADQSSNPESLIRADSVWSRPVSPLYTTLSDGSPVWYAFGVHMNLRVFRAYVRRQGTLYRAAAGYSSTDQESRLWSCFSTIAPTLNRTQVRGKLIDPLYGDAIDFPGEWANGALYRWGGFSSYASLSTRITAGRLNAYAADVESAMAIMEAKARELGAKLGARQSLSFSGGQGLWAEAQDGDVSFYGAVARGGRFYYVYMDRHRRDIKPEHRAAFLTTLQSIRP